jgi:hypothetical protein
VDLNLHAELLIAGCAGPPYLLSIDSFVSLILPVKGGNDLEIVLVGERHVRPQWCWAARRQPSQLCKAQAGALRIPHNALRLRRAAEDGA